MCLIQNPRIFETTIPKAKIFIVAIFAPFQPRLLEYGQASSLRTPPAGLLMFAPSFCNEAKTEPPRTAAIAADFRAHARPQPPCTAPLVRPRPGISKGQSLGNWKAGRTSGRDGRLRSARGRNSNALAAQGGDSVFIPPPKGSLKPKQASQQCSQRNRLFIFESAMPAGTSSATDKNLFSRIPTQRHFQQMGSPRTDERE